MVLALADAIQRGVVQASDSGGARQWLTGRAAFLEPAEASRLSVAAEVLNRPENARVRAVFVAGGLSAAMLVTVLGEVPHAMAALPDACREEVLGYYVQLVRPGSTRAGLRALTRRIIAEFGHERAADAEEKARRAESVCRRELPGGLGRCWTRAPPGSWRAAGDLIPVVLGGTGEPVDVGRETRLFTGAVRTAIIVPDKHCTFPGCDRPAGWCEAHHIVPGGPAGPPPQPTAPCCARATTAWSTPRATSRPSPPTGSCSGT